MSYTPIDNYDFSNANTVSSLSSDNVDGIGQSFTGNGEDIKLSVFEVTRQGSPTGNAVSKIYAHSGSFGTSSVPTGAALATSDNVDVATLSTDATETLFIFSTPFTTVNATNYVVSVEYSGGNSTNRIRVGIDTTSPTHNGNFSSITLPAGWVEISTFDVVFLVGFSEIDSVSDRFSMMGM